jgi:integrase
VGVHFENDTFEGAMALTDTEIKKAKPNEKAYRMSDSGGMYLWVTPSGGKLWRWAYKFEGKEKLMALGKYPAVSLALARERHGEARKLLATGSDPMALRKVEKTADQVASENSFASIAAEWLEHWQGGKSLRHVDSTRRRLNSNILPSLGALQITEIEAPDIVAMIKAIEARGARDIAKRAMETTGQIFRHAIAHGKVKRNPAQDFRPSDVLKVTRKTNYARIDEKELPHLLKEIEIYRGTPLTRLALKLMALTFVRTSELIGAKWSEFDLEAARWNVPAERMKMRTQHIVPLSRQSLEILALLRELSGVSEWVFPGEGVSNQTMSNNTILKGLERMGYKGRMTGHGFRGLASTILHEKEYPHEHIELQLAHAPRNAVSAAYNHAQHLKRRTKMMQEWADFLEHAQRGAKVLSFPDRTA